MAAKIPAAKLKAALVKNLGNYLATAQDLTDHGFPTSRQNIAQRVSRSKALQTLLAEAEANLLDLAEHQSAALINARDGPQIRWYLDRKGRRRGYGPPNAAVTIEGGDGKSGVVVTVQINGADAEL